MCGIDLETDYEAATSDILEMCRADISDKADVLLYTGGTLEWQNGSISSNTNQIWQVMHNIVCIRKIWSGRL